MIRRPNTITSGAGIDRVGPQFAEHFGRAKGGGRHLFADSGVGAWRVSLSEFENENEDENWLTRLIAHGKGALVDTARGR